jgi:RNA polymerase sigma factor (sigma-70 family)
MAVRHLTRTYPWLLRKLEYSDLEQMACVALLRTLRGYDPARGELTGSYVRVMLRNRLRDQLRMDGYMQRPSQNGYRIALVQADSLPVDEDADVWDFFGGQDPTIVEDLIREERLDQLERKIDQLPELQQIAIYDALVGGKRSETAVTLGISESRASHLFNEALAALKAA